MWQKTILILKKINFKIIFIIAGSILYQSFFYLIAKLTPIKVTVLTSAVDRNLPLIEEFIYLYYLWYLMLFIIPYIIYLKNKSMFVEYITVFACCVIGAFVVFCIFPTTVIRPEIVVSDFSSFLLNFVYFTDTPALNCLPSMHCVICFMFIYYSFCMKNLRWYYKLLITILSILIIFSTLFVKQHVIWDVISALILVVAAVLVVKLTKLDHIIHKHWRKIKTV